MAADPKKHSYRIGTISKLAGIPVPTLRVWESRYGAFSPDKTGGQHRMYGEEDLLRATLLKQLSDQGHPISTIANLGIDALSQLKNKYHHESLQDLRTTRSQIVKMNVIGLGLAGRIESQNFSRHLVGSNIAITQIYKDLDAAKLPNPDINQTDSPVEILLIKVNTLHEIIMHDIKTIQQQHTSKHAGHAPQVIVLYNYGRETVAHAMRSAGMLVRREPITDYELSELIRSVLMIDTSQSLLDITPSSMIPARKYSDETLGRVAGISTNVLCECPRHVAEIITQLASFEQYSQECLNKSAEDAHLHAFLTSVSGTARALFEHALEKVAQHENIQL